MPERRHLREQFRLDVVAGHEHVRGLEVRGEAGLDEILAFDREQPELVAPASVVELADELEPFVVARGDQLPTASPEAARSFGRAAAASPPSLPALSAALACSAIAPNAAGSLTA